MDIFSKGIDEITREITKTNVALKSSNRCDNFPFDHIYDDSLTFVTCTLIPPKVQFNVLLYAGCSHDTDIVIYYSQFFRNIAKSEEKIRSLEKEIQENKDAIEALQVWFFVVCFFEDIYCYTQSHFFSF